MAETEVLRANSDIFIYRDAITNVYRAWPSPFVVTENDHKLQFRNLTAVTVTLTVESFGADKQTLVLGPKDMGQDKAQVKVKNVSGVFEYTGVPDVVGNSGPKVIVDL